MWTLWPRKSCNTSIRSADFCIAFPSQTAIPEVLLTPRSTTCFFSQRRPTDRRSHQWLCQVPRLPVLEIADYRPGTFSSVECFFSARSKKYAAQPLTSRVTQNIS